jgi:transposase
MEETKPGPAPEPEWAAFVAIDWADQKHFWRLANAADGKQECGEMESTPEAVDGWAAALNTRFAGRPIAVCLEQCKGSLACIPSGAKSDPSDTASLLDLLLRHRDRLRRLQPDTSQTRLLGILVEGRRVMVNEKTRQKNRLTAILKIYFPQLLQWFDEMESPVVRDLLGQWPTLAELKSCHPGTLKKFLGQHHCGSEERIRERIAVMYAAIPATEDEAILAGESMKAQSLVKILGVLREQIAEYDRRIAELVAAHPDSQLFASLPGAGAALVPRLIVAFGTQRDRFATAYEVQCLSGIAPVTEASGKSEWVHFRWACPKFMRQTFHEFAACSTRKPGWAKAYYEEQRHNHKSHHAAVRSLAHKWIRILFRCWKDGQPYDEQIYLRALKRTGSPLIDSFQLDTQGEWKSVAEFQKFSALPS